MSPRIEITGAPLPILATERTTDSARAPPPRDIYYLHGIFGSGRNWRSVARRVHTQRPDWGSVLVDLRMHGESQEFHPPHTIAACAADVGAALGLHGATDCVLLGHSFGGKVALAAAGLSDAVWQVWVIDSTPSARAPAGGDAMAMLTTLESLPREFATREAAVADLMRTGQQRLVAEWMATNLLNHAGVWRWRFSLTAMRELLADFHRTDLWRVVEDARRPFSVHVVKAADSTILATADMERLEGLPEGSDAYLHHVSGGHWVNMDSPSELAALLTVWLPEWAPNTQ
ncbi:MAG: alpha/beta hydrolase [Gemmatimonadota bacterium]